MFLAQSTQPPSSPPPPPAPPPPPPWAGAVRKARAHRGGPWMERGVRGARGARAAADDGKRSGGRGRSGSWGFGSGAGRPSSRPSAGSGRIWWWRRGGAGGARLPYVPAKVIAASSSATGAAGQERPGRVRGAVGAGPGDADAAGGDAWGVREGGGGAWPRRTGRGELLALSLMLLFLVEFPY